MGDARWKELHCEVHDGWGTCPPIVFLSLLPCSLLLLLPLLIPSPHLPPPLAASPSTPAETIGFMNPFMLGDHRTAKTTSSVHEALSSECIV